MDYSQVLDYARELRKNQTEPEKIFWNLVRNRKFLGYKFTRQYIIKYSIAGVVKYFIVDFFCVSKKLIVELDGPYHKYQLATDKERENILAGYGYKVIRYTNKDIEGNILQVKQHLEGVLSEPKLD